MSFHSNIQSEAQNQRTEALFDDLSIKSNTAKRVSTFRILDLPKEIQSKIIGCLLKMNWEANEALIGNTYNRQSLETTMVMSGYAAGEDMYQYYIDDDFYDTKCLGPSASIRASSQVYGFRYNWKLFELKEWAKKTGALDIGFVCKHLYKVTLWEFFSTAPVCLDIDLRISDHRAETMLPASFVLEDVVSYLRKSYIQNYTPYIHFNIWLSNQFPYLESLDTMLESVVQTIKTMKRLKSIFLHVDVHDYEHLEDDWNFDAEGLDKFQDIVLPFMSVKLNGGFLDIQFTSSYLQEQLDPEQDVDWTIPRWEDWKICVSGIHRDLLKMMHEKYISTLTMKADAINDEYSPEKTEINGEIEFAKKKLEAHEQRAARWYARRAERARVEEEERAVRTEAEDLAVGNVVRAMFGMDTDL